MNKKILIIENDPFLGEVLDLKLSNQGYEVTLIESGAEGLRQMSVIMPDMILQDMALPFMNGYEILEAKSQDPKIAKIPVIIISNSGQAVEINRVLALGACDYLIKSDLNPDEVVAKVKLHFADEDQKRARGDGVNRLDGIKILFVEDDAFLSDLITHKLTIEGAKLSTASKGEDALILLEKETPDIILLDILLPGINGFDILVKIRQNEKLKGVPVIVLTNLSRDSDKERAKTLGVAKYLVKADLDTKDIVEEIRTVLKNNK